VQAGWQEDPKDGTWSVPIAIDYADLWRGKEREIAETIAKTIESPVTYLTEEQAQLLTRSPREFLKLNPRPESAELVDKEADPNGRITRLIVAAPPKDFAGVRYLAVVPNLVQIERQLDALDVVEQASDEGPLGPLRALVGLCAMPATIGEQLGSPAAEDLERGLDETQIEALRKALATPHFAVIQGPPGSGKTTVISSVIRQLTRERSSVLVVSPTHVAVDNVVEKLVSLPKGCERDSLEPHSLPVRYAARRSMVSDVASKYWVGAKGRARDAMVSQRLRDCVSASLPFAPALYETEDADRLGHAPLSQALAEVQRVVCGTPIGILSFPPVKVAAAASYDLLIVDEVSKMTLSEFLAIAIKAKRWMLVGDPEQLPPFQDCIENAPTLDDVLSPIVELACSVVSALERFNPGNRVNERLLVAADDPAQAVAAIRAQVGAVRFKNSPQISVYGDGFLSGIVVCKPGELTEAAGKLLPVAHRDRTHNPQNRGGLQILVQRGLEVSRPEFATGTPFVEERDRCQASIFEVSFNTYHAQPWAQRNQQKLFMVSMRNGLENYLPSQAVLDCVAGTSLAVGSSRSRGVVLEQIAKYFAVNTVSVYDWLIGMPIQYFDVSPLAELKAISQGGLYEAIKPYSATLRKQYRMHSSLSAVPRQLFYCGDALIDGRKDRVETKGVFLCQVQRTSGANDEVNPDEGITICEMIRALNAEKQNEASVMVITPYREQMAHLNEQVNALREAGQIDRLAVEVLTLDRCQGREADFVLISLVRNRTSLFLEMPKRWNVALTRAREGLALVGDIDAFLREAEHARTKARLASGGGGHLAGPDRNRPNMSLMARIMECYHQQAV
jgi:DNA polymerase III delta prime subunit